MPTPDSDPRVFFAAERTLLAWLRTGLAIIAIGFVVSRFGLFVEVLGVRSDPAIAANSAPYAGALGVTFVIVGSLVIAIAAIQHNRFIATISRDDLPRTYSTALAVVLSLVLAALGIALAAYLVFA
jgi:putative membrane protein